MAEKCKKCGKELPANSTGKLCGYCKQKQKDTAIKIASGVVSVAVIAGGAVANPDIKKIIMDTGKKAIKAIKSHL